MQPYRYRGYSYVRSMRRERSISYARLPGTARRDFQTFPILYMYIKWGRRLVGFLIGLAYNMLLLTCRNWFRA